MSKKQKLLFELCKTPAPCDFPWEKLVTLMNRAGFQEQCEGGSHYMFQHTSGLRLSMSKTHPSGVLKRYQISAAIDALRQVGELGDQSNGE